MCVCMYVCMCVFILTVYHRFSIEADRYSIIRTVGPSAHTHYFHFLPAEENLAQFTDTPGLVLSRVPIFGQVVHGNT